MMNKTSISKSEFLLFCDAPRHLWAKKHERIAQETSDFARHLAEEGNRVEELAEKYLSTVLVPQHDGEKLLWQQSYQDGPYAARLDGLVYKVSSNSYDLYEIKSATGVDKDIVYDVAFQAAVLDKQIKVDHFYVLHLNKEYNRSGELDLASLFIAEDVTDKVNDLKNEIFLLREEALRVAQLDDPEEAEGCLSPKDCPCPDLCHANLPEFSIHDIPRLARIKKLQLLGMGIKAAEDIPVTFDLNAKQRLVAETARTGDEHIDRESIRAALDGFQYPVWFLDYETCICAIPPFDGYHPQQQIVFQYSLHCLEQPGGELKHFSHAAMPKADPSLSLLENLSGDLGAVGTVVVWNKTFEMTMNREMAKVHPEFAAFVEDLNARIYDLGELVNLGYYLHPGFKGSWSIKNVLPVMVPHLSYKKMAINKGDQASVAWWNITFGELEENEKKKLVEALKKYCELDTLAMVEIVKKFQALARNGAQE
jgi:hypothetical protein